MRLFVFTLSMSILWNILAQDGPLVSLGADQKLVYKAFANHGESDEVNFIPDFSTAGFKMGGIELPKVAVRISLSPLEGDNRAHIQNAIDQISSLPEDINGFRGAILLKAGKYPCSGPLYIEKSGIVLRGEKQDLPEYGGTQLIATATYKHNFIQCKGNLQSLENKPQALDTIWIPQRYADESGNIIDGQIWVEANILAAAQDAQNKDGKISLQMVTNLNDYSSYHSKEAAKAPYLEITYRKDGAESDSVLIIESSDDAFVRGGEYTNQNYGTDDELVVKYNGEGSDVTRETFIKFSLPLVEEKIKSATLNLWCQNAGNNSDMPHYVFASANTDWDESNINYGNKPSLSIPLDRMLDLKVGGGQKKMRIENADKYYEKQKILVKRTPNQAWIDALGMGQYGWTPAAYQVEYPMEIAHISGDTITLSTPLVHCMDQKYGGAEVTNDSRYGFLNLVGIEHMLITSNYMGDEDEEHGWSAIHISDSRNCWVKNVSAQHFGYACVHLRNVFSSTIEDCAMLDPKSITTGSRKYSFAIDKSTNNLVQRCYTRGGRHDYVTGAQVAGPNVFLDCLSEETYNDIGPHHRYATGILFDNIVGGQARVQNRKDSGTGHGWAGAQVMFWNVSALDAEIKVESPIGAMNWGIGCRAGLKEGAGYWESWNEEVQPRSLYLQQLKDRLGEDALENISTPSQMDGSIHHQLEQWKGLEHRKNLESKAYMKNDFPGKIECEHFDFGINGESYIDLSPNNNGYSLRPTDVDLYTQPARINGKIETISFVGDIEAGERLNYSIYLQPGMYTFEIQYASTSTENRIMLYLNNQTDTISLPPTRSLLDFEQTQSSSFRIDNGDNYIIQLLCLDASVNLDHIASQQSSNLSNYVKSTGVKLYPNPSKGFFYVEGFEIKDLSIVDIYGRSISSHIQYTPQGALVTLASRQRGLVLVSGKTKTESWSKWLSVF